MVDLARERGLPASPAAPERTASTGSPDGPHMGTPDDSTASGMVADSVAQTLAVRAAERADALVETATEHGDAELADAARVVAGEALLQGGDIDGARTRLLGLERVSTGSLSDELDAAAVTAAVFVAAGEASAAKRLLTRAAKRLAAGQEGSASLDTAHGPGGARRASRGDRPRPGRSAWQPGRHRDARTMAQCHRPVAVAGPPPPTTSSPR